MCSHSEASPTRQQSGVMTEKKCEARLVKFYHLATKKLHILASENNMVSLHGHLTTEVNILHKGKEILRGMTTIFSIEVSDN